MIKKSENDLLTSVCAGIGEWIGISPVLGEIIGLFLFFSTNWFWIVYFILYILMDNE